MPKLFQIDATTAFLYDFLNDEAYVHQLPEFVHKNSMCSNSPKFYMLGLSSLPIWRKT